VILISAAKIEGDTIELFGLGLSFSKPNLIYLLRIVSAYLLWVFFWVSITEYYPKVKNVLIENHQRMVEHSLQKTREIDDEVYSHQEEDHGHHEPDGWWEAHHEYEMKKRASISRLEKIDQLFVIGRLVVVDVLPVTVLAGFAIFAPDFAAKLLSLN
jgi:ABC-type nickel/cobalt efflux system permease component RcnA